MVLLITYHCPKTAYVYPMQIIPYMGRENRLLPKRRPVALEIHGALIVRTDVIEAFEALGGETQIRLYGLGSLRSGT